MDKRKGKTQYDEYFSDGIVELGRIGNVVTLKNNMSEEQADMQDVYKRQVLIYYKDNKFVMNKKRQ